jgi:DNA polymerase III delta prime subunit
MKEVGSSTLWVERYRPKYLVDYICSEANRSLIQSVLDEQEVDCWILEGMGGTGKTTLGYIIANELDMDLLYINGSIETSVDTIRYKVSQFCTSSSLTDNKKLVIIDELDRMSLQAQDALKVLQEQTESNARFIFCTNNLQRIIQPLMSRATHVIRFGREKSKELVIAYFKRLAYILDTQEVKYDKKVLAELTQLHFPDMRKLIGVVQTLARMHGEIDERALAFTDDTKVTDLILEMKGRKFNNVRKICADMDTSTFYTQFYAQIDQHLADECKPDVVLVLARYAAQDASTCDKEVNLVACVVEVMQSAKWR